MEHPSVYSVSVDEGFMAEMGDVCSVLDREVRWSTPPTLKKRAMQIYGDRQVYTARFGGYGARPLQVVERPILPWSECPLVEAIRDHVTWRTGQRYNVCIVQRYPSNEVGISSHRDKETTSTIAGVSFGATRELVMTPSYLPSKWGYRERRYTLPNGSLYQIRAPTNDRFMHSIPASEVLSGVRISLTFRWDA
jgi:alkylated DNA repair dioxygenase AlkB